MASNINYTTFATRIGKIVNQLNLWTTEQGTTLLGPSSGAQAILAEYTAAPSLTVGLQSSFQGFANTVAGWEAALKVYADNTILANQSALNVSSASVSAVLAAMITDMTLQSPPVTFNRNTASVPSTGTAASTNLGNGRLVLFADNIQGYPDERILNEQVTALCVRDRFNGASPGAESFTLTGYPSSSPYNYLPMGSGTTSQFGTFDNNSQYNKLLNPSFDSYTSTSGFNSWTQAVTLNAGTYTVGYTWITLTGETTISPVGTVTVTAGEAISVTLPALPTGAIGANVYMADATSDYLLQYAGLPSAAVWPIANFWQGVNPPTTNTSGISAPTAAPTVAAYTPASVPQDTTRVMPATGGGALLLTPSSAGPVFIMQPLSGISSLGIDLAYVLSGWLSQYSVVSGSNLTIGLVNAGTFQTLFNGDPSTLTEAYTLENAAFWLTEVTPNANIMIVWSNSGSAVGSVLVDSMVFGPMVNFGNVQVALLRGKVDFVQNDTFTYETTNNNAGVFQTFFGRYYGVQVNSSTSPTIPDSLAT